MLSPTTVFTAYPMLVTVHLVAVVPLHDVLLIHIGVQAQAAEIDTCLYTVDISVLYCYTVKLLTLVHVSMLAVAVLAWPLHRVGGGCFPNSASLVVTDKLPTWSAPASTSSLLILLHCLGS